MIKKVPFLFVIIATLIACETEEFDVINSQSTEDSITIDEDINNGDDSITDIDIIDTNSCNTPERLIITKITNKTLNLT